MSVSFPIPTAGHKAEPMAFGSRMEAATEALLRIRDEVVATLDRQVIELQQIHRALAYAPPPMVETEDIPFPMAIAPAAVSPPTVAKTSLFEDAPRIPGVPVVHANSVPQAVLPASPMRITTQPFLAVTTMEESSLQFPEPQLDPVLERATLEELNDALASAFAMVSSRSDR